GRIAASPRPSRRAARSMVAWRSSLATIRTRGAPCSPSRSTSHPTARRTWWRPAAIPTVLPACAPVTRPTVAVGGRPSSSSSHPDTARSAATAAGESASLNATWSHPAASTSAAVAAGGDPHRVARLGAGDQADGGGGRQTGQLERPPRHRALGGHRGGGERVVERDLVPPGREHVGRGGGREGPADDEAEVARARRAHQPVLGRRDELVDDPLRRGARARQRPAEPLQQRIRAGGGLHRAVRQGGPVVAG